METEIKTKFFRNGGSVAVRIPSAWSFNPEQVTMTFDEITRQITITQQPRRDIQDFFDLQDRLGPIDDAQPLFDREQQLDAFASPLDELA